MVLKSRAGQGLKAKAAQCFKATTDSRHNKPVAPNILAQNFNSTEPNKAWCVDITYIPTQEGWLYLATVIDLYSRMIVGWSMSKSLKTQLVDDALKLAYWQVVYTIPIEALNIAAMRTGQDLNSMGSYAQ